MVPEPQIGRSQLSDLAVLCTVPVEDLTRLVNELTGLKLTVERKSVDDIVRRVVGETKAVAVSRLVFGIAVALRHDQLTLDSVLATIEASVTSELALSEKPELKAWSTRRDILLRLLNIESVRLSAKALDVSYDFERVYVTSRFLTTMRPIFNEGRSEIRGAAVVQTLRLEFLTPSGEQTNVSLAMDWADIQQLKRACDDALKKASATVQKARTVWNLPTLMQGEGDHE